MENSQARMSKMLHIAARGVCGLRNNTSRNKGNAIIRSKSIRIIIATLFTINLT